MGQKTLPDHLGCLHSKSFFCLVYTPWDIFDIAYVDRMIQVSTNRKFVNRVPFTGQETSFLPGIDRLLTPFFVAINPWNCRPPSPPKRYNGNFVIHRSIPCLSRELFEHTIGEKRVSPGKEGKQSIIVGRASQQENTSRLGANVVHDRTLH